MQRKALLTSPSSRSTSWWLSGRAAAVVQKGSARERSGGYGTEGLLKIK